MGRLALVFIAALALAAGGCRQQPEASPGVLSARTPAAKAIISEEPWEFAGAPGRLMRTQNYRIFTTDNDGAIQRHLPAFLESCLDRYTYELAPLPRPPFKLDTFLVADREQWTKLTRQLMGEHAATYLRIQRGGFASGGRAILWSIGVRDTFAIAAHEGWHQYTQRTFRGELPEWLEEGIGVYMEGLRLDQSGKPIAAPWANLERFDQLRRAAQENRLLGLGALVRTMPQEMIAASGAESTLTWYAQVWALTMFLHEAKGGYYRPALRGLLADAAADSVDAAVAVRLGRKISRDQEAGADVFAAYFGPPHALEAEYRAFVERMVRADRASIAEGVSPVAGER